MRSAASNSMIFGTRFGALILLSWLCVFAHASDSVADQLPAASTPIDPTVFDSYGERVLFFSSDIADAVTKAREEAVRQNVNLNEMTRYMVFFGKGDYLRVSLAPPYTGGLDGPEFQVEFRRSDLKLLKVENKLH
jgi:hypothetical protein